MNTIAPSTVTTVAVVMVAYLGILLFIGWRAARRTHGGEDFHLAAAFRTLIYFYGKASAILPGTSTIHFFHYPLYNPPLILILAAVHYKG